MSEIEDLIGRSGGIGDCYFDPRDFEIRETAEEGHYWHLHRCAIIFELMRAICPDTSARILDIGCGTGRVATHLNQHGWHVDYSDVHRQGLEVARRRAEVRLGATVDDRRFIRLDITHQFPSHRYLGALLLDVLEHLPDDAAVMRNLHQGLTAGQERAPQRFHRPFVVFTVPAFEMLWSPWDDLERHKRRYTLDQARRLAEHSGFAVERLSYFFFPLFFAALGMKSLRAGRRAVLGAPAAPASIVELTESRSIPTINRVILRLLSLESRWLQQRDLPLGTSILCVARPV